MDYFLEDKRCVERLLNDYHKHGNLIIALDFDNTIYDFHNKGLEFNDVIALIKECNVLGFQIVIYTANKDYDLIQRHCDNIGIKIYGINKNVLTEFSDSGKIYYSILMDDRSGLRSAYETLKETIKIIKEEQNEN